MSALKCCRKRESKEIILEIEKTVKNEELEQEVQLLILQYREICTARYEKGSDLSFRIRGMISAQKEKPKDERIKFWEAAIGSKSEIGREKKRKLNMLYSDESPPMTVRYKYYDVVDDLIRNEEPCDVVRAKIKEYVQLTRRSKSLSGQRFVESLTRHLHALRRIPDQARLKQWDDLCKIESTKECRVKVVDDSERLKKNRRNAAYIAYAKVYLTDKVTPEYAQKLGARGGRGKQVPEVVRLDTCLLKAFRRDHSEFFNDNDELLDGKWRPLGIKALLEWRGQSRSVDSRSGGLDRLADAAVCVNQCADLEAAKRSEDGAAKRSEERSEDGSDDNRHEADELDEGSAGVASSEERPEGEGAGRTSPHTSSLGEGAHTSLPFAASSPQALALNADSSQGAENDPARIPDRAEGGSFDSQGGSEQAAVVADTEERDGEFSEGLWAALVSHAMMYEKSFVPD